MTERLTIDEAEVQGVIQKIPTGLLEELEDRLGAAIPDLMEGKTLGRKGRAINYLLLAAADPGADGIELWARAGTMPMPEIRTPPEEDIDEPADPTTAPLELGVASSALKQSA